jgi:methylene-fatty-acyl-phospholipid synthase
MFTLAVKDQPRGPEHFPFLALPEVVAFGYIISTIGSMFVGFSMYSLGIHGTYLGDYFGILKTERVTGFPFNVVEHPMYYGSTMCFLGKFFESVARKSNF